MILYNTSRLCACRKDSIDGETDIGIQGWIIITGTIFCKDLKELDSEQKWIGEPCGVEGDGRGEGWQSIRVKIRGDCHCGTEKMN